MIQGWQSGLVLQFSLMAITDIPRAELEVVFRGRPHLDALWQKVARGATDFTRQEEIQLVLMEARVYDLRGQFARTGQLAQEAERRARECGDSNAIGTSMALRGYVLARFGDYAQARRLCIEALAYFDESPDMVQALRGVANYSFALDDWTRAELYFDRAIKTSRALDYAFGLSTSLMDAAELYYSQGRFEVALSALDESARFMERAGMTTHRGFYLVNLAWIYCLTGNRTHARRTIQELLQFTHALIFASYYHLFGAWLALLEQDLPTAVKELLEARQASETQGEATIIGHVRWLYSWLHRLQGNLGNALEWADEAVGYMRRSLGQSDQGMALLERARAYVALNDVEHAEADLRTVSEMAGALGAKFLAAQAALQRAVLHWQGGQADAPALWLEAVRHIQYGGYGFLLEQERAAAFPMVAAYARSREPALRASADTMLDQLARVAPLPLHIVCLGRFEVWQGRRKIPERDWSKRRVGELLRFLLVQPGYSASRDDVQDALLPDAPPESAQTFFHHATSTLRRILEPDLPEKFPSRYLDVAQEQITLRLPSGSTVDFEMFLNALPRAAGSLADLEEALGLYGGELFPQDRYGDWSVETREHLSELHREARLALAKKQLAEGQATAALDTCRKILASDPWREDAVLVGMRACLALNDRPAALKLYRALKTTLRDEFQIAPREDITALARTISDPTET